MPDSVLWVFLIVVWLFVVVPMVLRGRPAARTSTKAAAQTRVVHRGGGRSAASRRGTTTARSSRAAAAAKRIADRKAAEEAARVEEEPIEVDAEIVDDVDDAVLETESVDVVDVEEVEMNEDAAESVEVAEIEADAVEPTEVVEIDAAETDNDEIVAEEPVAEAPVEVPVRSAESAVEVTDVFEPVDDDEVVDLDEAQAAHADETFDILSDEDDTDDEPARPAPPPRELRGRGGLAPGHVREREEAAYRERRRVVLGLGVFTLLSVVSAFLVQPLGYVFLGVMLVASAGYLAFLRRAVRIDHERRAQRIARQRRRAAEDARIAREQAEPLYVAPPPRLRRPGGAIVLEIDDEDPVFEHLPTYDFAGASAYDTDYDDVAHRRAV